MLLTIDVGNTNTVFAVYKERELIGSWRCQTVSARSADEYAAFLKELFLLSGLQFTHMQDVIIGSVVPEANFHLIAFCRKYTKLEPVFVTNEIVGLDIDLDNPAEIGADRLVNAVAVLAHHQVPAIVIDFGTATTFDVIDEKGRYCGGVIAPGINLSVEALHQASAKLPRVNVQKPKAAIGKNTIEAMQSGMYWGYISLIEGLVEKISQELGEKPFVLATGGLAALYAQTTDVIQQVDDELTLKGLLEIHLKSQKRKAA